ncbi:MAG: VTT domain-containing protein [Candidatus Dormibacteraeota bacterium]|nr:VTT domain-containing protein [Candidatus Dormibacteraeota bacterium]MBV8445127.1 VTT domain-containing protein [Candidatus Dormibacteraeota bacterium]
MDQNAEAEVAAVPERPPVRPGWKDVLCIGPIVAYIIYTLPYIGVPIQAVLIGSHPVLLSALRGSIASMVASGAFARVGRASLIAVVVAPIPVLMFSDPFFFWAGRRYGRRLLEYLEEHDQRWRRSIARGERFFQRFGVWAVVLAPVLPVPSALFYLAAGEAGMPFIVFILADLAGTLLYIGAVVGAGWAVGQPAVNAAQAISTYSLWVIGGLFVVILVASMVNAWRTQRNASPRP